MSSTSFTSRPSSSSATSLRFPFGSSAHVIITFQDLIAYRVPAVFHTDADFEVYRTTSSLSLLCASGILAYSSHAREEIAAEFGIPDR